MATLFALNYVLLLGLKNHGSRKTVNISENGVLVCSGLFVHLVTGYELWPRKAEQIWYGPICLISTWSNDARKFNPPWKLHPQFYICFNLICLNVSDNDSDHSDDLEAGFHWHLLHLCSHLSLTNFSCTLGYCQCCRHFSVNWISNCSVGSALRHQWLQKYCSSMLGSRHWYQRDSSN